ncbi:hypothetical protein CTI12_AA570280 [Artemisia annua]|uniref:Uncharacterized protein n=1 Tax=Artemisia annua TaxID=35608 RepID=A0A2U1KS79_ARTAN|nr:hypothetical protein CTI12_AA570280 [Artemisia annua]
MFINVFSATNDWIDLANLSKMLCQITVVVCWLQSPNREGINNDDLLRYFGVNGLRSIGVSRKTP